MGILIPLDFIVWLLLASATVTILQYKYSGIKRNQNPSLRIHKGTHRHYSDMVGRTQLSTA